MMKKIIIVTSPACLPSIPFSGDIGLLFECAPESHIHLQFPQAIALRELIGDKEMAGRLGCLLANKILKDEPYFRNVAQLSIFKEPISWGFQRIFLLFNLHKFLLNRGVEICEFTSHSWWSRELYRLTHYFNSSLQVITPSIASSNRLQRVFERVRVGKFSLRALYMEWKTGLDQLDPFHRRSLWSNLFRRPRDVKNKIWFYSTANTFTRIGLQYESFFPESFCFLVENPLTGGQPLKEKQRSFAWLYRFAAYKDIPTQYEVQRAADAISQHVQRASLSKTESAARDFFLKSDWMEIFFSTRLKIGLFYSALFKRWLAKVKPSALIVGAHSFEGYALYQARAQKIITILLQHGTSDYTFSYLEYPLDFYIMRGRFWYDCLGKAAQKKAWILNSFKYIEQEREKKDAIVFITAPFKLRFISLEVDLDTILLGLLKSLQKKHTKLIVRVHPLERIIDYQNKIQMLLHKENLHVDIEYSQYGSLESVLARAMGAVIFASTVIFDCIAQRVPVISFDWSDFWYKENIKPYRIYHYAKDLNDFKCLVESAISHTLLPPQNDEHHILENLSRQEIKERIKGMLNNASAVSSETR